MNWEIFWIVVGALILFGVGFYLFSTVVAAFIVYRETLVRKHKDMWGRTVSFNSERMHNMDREGLAWQREHDAFKKEVHIVNKGLNLYGEYYDLGFDKAVMILSGRTESLRYGYYFARPYSESGFNVLVVDPRAHGLSDGKYNTVGFEESGDALSWTEYIHETFGMDTIIFHGICIGAAGGMYAITSDNCPDYIKGLVTEGMFVNFRESVKNHLIERKKLMFPILECIDMWMKHYTGHSFCFGPINVIHKMNKPLLMLQSLEDKYSTAENAKKLYAACGSENKQLVLFEKGDHSMLRITDTEKYDATIKAFLQKHFSACGNTAE